MKMESKLTLPIKFIVVCNSIVVGVFTDPATVTFAWARGAT